MNGNRTIVLALGATALVVTLDDVRRGELPRPRNYIGILFAGLVLTLMAGPAPELAGGLAVLMATAVVLTRGTDLFSGLNIGAGPAAGPPRPADYYTAGVPTSAPPVPGSRYS